MKTKVLFSLTILTLFLSPGARAGFCQNLLAQLRLPSEKPKGYFIPDKTFGQIEVIPTLLPEPVMGVEAWNYGSVEVGVTVNGTVYSTDFLVTGREYGWEGHFLAENLSGRTLDVGCGPQGLEVRGLRHHGLEAYGIDVVVTDHDTDYIKRASVTDIPFPDNFFDHIISNFSVFFYSDEHTLHNPAREAYLLQAASEMVRVLAPGGNLYGNLNDVTLQWLLKKFPQLESRHLPSGEVFLQKN